MNRHTHHWQSQLATSPHPKQSWFSKESDAANLHVIFDARSNGRGDLDWLKEEGLRREGTQEIGMLTISRVVKSNKPTQLLVCPNRQIQMALYAKSKVDLAPAWQSHGGWPKRAMSGIGCCFRATCCVTLCSIRLAKTRCFGAHWILPLDNYGEPKLPV